MTPQELKSSILQLAVQGRLVEQRPEEGTAEELYRQIQEEKQRLIKEGKIKKEKPLPEIAEDEVPFDIPESWKWVKIGSLLHKLVDGTHRTPKYTTSGVPFVSVKNMSNGVLSLENTKYISKAEHVELWKRCNPQKGDLLLSKVGTTGVPAKINTEIEFSLFVSVALLKFNNDYIDIDFLLYSILAPDFQKQCQEHTRGVGNKNWVIKDIANTLMPFPPLAEQKRIVAKIEELLPYIDRYEKAWSKLEDFNKRFPDDMQKSVLQMAIQGKLVEQRPEEGTGEELFQQLLIERESLIICKRFKRKKLPELSSDDLPFDIPETWKWVRLGDIISIESGKGLTSSQMQEGNIPVYGGNGITGHHDTSLLHEEIVVIGRVGFYCGSVHVTEKESWVTDNAFITTYPTRSINREYLVYVLKHMNLGQNNNATAQPVVSGKKIYPLPFPLPPLAEQKRIVQKLEQILPLCEKLK